MTHDRKGARDAYTAAIETRDAPADLRASALYNRALLYAAANEIPDAMQDLGEVLAMEASPHKVKLAARQKIDRMQRRHYVCSAPRLHTHAPSRQVTSLA